MLHAKTRFQPALFLIAKSNMPLIGLTGKAGAGKDTIGNFIVHEYDFQKEAFAKPLKQATSALFGISENIMEDRIKKETPILEWGKSPRQLNQWLGTDVLRNQFGEDFFVKSMRERISKDRRVYGSFVITDCRFDNEAQFILESGGMVFQVDRNTQDKNDKNVNISEECKGHVTEQGISPHLLSGRINNNGYFSETIEEIKKIMVLFQI